MNKFIATAAIFGAIAFTTAPVYAQDVAQHDHVKGDISDFHGSPDSLIQAINTIEQATGAHVVEIRFAERDGMPGYHAVLLKDGQVTFMHLDEQSGQIVGLEANSAPAWMLSSTKRTQLHFDRKASVSLSRAIRVAENSEDADGGSAVAAGIAADENNDQTDIHAYTVVINHGGMTQRVAVDAADGQVIANPGSLR